MNSGRYSVEDVARYIINYSHDIGKPISNLKLQKILYFVQAVFLVEVGEACFSEDMEAWDFGPVVPCVYHEYKIYGAGTIPRINEYYVYDKKQSLFSYRRKKFSAEMFSAKDRDVIDAMITTCCQYSASQLVESSHKQAPWKNAYRRHYNNIITQESIRAFFEESING